MGVTEILIIFLISSWLVFFAVAGIGVTSQHETGEVERGTDPSAPMQPMLRKKFIWACTGGAITTLVFYLASALGLFSWIMQISPYGAA